MATLLPTDEIVARLAMIPNWELSDKSITRKYLFDSFLDAISFVNMVAKKAEEIDHHPEIYISYKEVNLSITTHSKGGITERDFRLVGLINQLKFM